MRPILITACLCIAALLTAGCKGEAPKAPADAVAAAPASTPAPATAPVAVDPAPTPPPTSAPAPVALNPAPAAVNTAPAAPRQMPLQHPEATALGALPDGVGLAVGQPAPDAALTDSDGATVNLRDLIAKGPVMLVFYRGGWCPFCNTQIHALTEAYPEFERRGVTPVAVSVDSIDEGAKSRAAFKIPFPVLSDSALVAHRAFNVLNVIADEEFARLKSFGIDLEASSKQTHHTIAIPSVFVIDKQGVIRWAHAETDYKKRPSVEQLLGALDAALK